MRWCAALRTSWRMTSAEKTDLSGAQHASCMSARPRLDDRSHRTSTALYGCRSNVRALVVVGAAVIITTSFCVAVCTHSP